MIKPYLRLFNVAAATLTLGHACVVIQYLWSICCVYLLQKMVVVFFLVFVGFENLATRDPEANFTVPDDEYVPTHSWMIRFAIATLAYILVGKSGLVSLVTILICKACRLQRQPDIITMKQHMFLFCFFFILSLFKMVFRQNV